uniref:Uncharacterized protein n=1 Tax=Anopheles dirus TaxID=7168 RepID=A0A182NY34_9DIPT
MLCAVLPFGTRNVHTRTHTVANIHPPLPPPPPAAALGPQ